MIPSKEEMNQALASRHGQVLQKKLTNSSVAICGLGGLGSHLAICLARLGIGHLILIDYDQVDVSNLHRQHYKISQIGQYKTDAMKENIKEISPYLRIRTHQVMIRPDRVQSLLQEADIICEAFDDAREKAMLVNSIFENIPDKYVVAASGMAGMGDVNLIQSRHINNHFFLCGDGVSDIAKEHSLFASRVMVCAGHQAHQVLHIINSHL